MILTERLACYYLGKADVPAQTVDLHIVSYDLLSI